LEKSASSSTCLPLICVDCVETLPISTYELTNDCRSKRLRRRTATSSISSANSESSTQ